MSQKNLQPGDLCFIVGYKSEQKGYIHNNKVVTLDYKTTATKTGLPCWVTQPRLASVDGAVAGFEEEHLKPFPKDLLKDEEKHDEELHA